MRIVVLTLALGTALGLAYPAAALDCAQMWLARNQIFNQAGHCFSSPLGVATFDNGDCTAGATDLSTHQAQLVAAFRDAESIAGCKIDTSTTQLTLPHQSDWLRLIDLPFPTDGESACIGWLGADLPLRAAHTTNAPILSRLQAGDTLLFAANPQDGWEFVQTDHGVGWLKYDAFSTKFCTRLAG